MKHNKHYIASLAIAGCALCAAAMGGGRDGKGHEKVRPAAAIAMKAGAKAASYPALLADGAPDGRPYGLRLMGVDDRQVRLSWLSPEATDGYFDDFESHDDFAINSPGSIGWQYIDGDNDYTYTWQACSFPNQGQRMAFIVMNPSLTTPATSSNPSYQPYSGSKMLVSFCPLGGKNNDFIISPALSFDREFRLSFMAKSYNPESFGNERLRVGYSTTGTSPSDFTFVSEGDYVQVPGEWTLYEYAMPKEARYVTVNCVSDDNFMLLIDDIFVGTNAVRPGVGPARVKAGATASGASLTGFNVYRDGAKANGAPVTQIRYTDTVQDYGDHTYTVTALYSDGTESDPSDPLAVNVPDTRVLPFEDDFETWTLDQDKWSTANADDNTSNAWGIDYYPRGLVDPAATFSYGLMYDYDQSLVTRELLTTNPAGTVLRFNLKLQNERHENTDYLAVEVTTDGGHTWQTAATYDNSQGAFDWRVCQLPIGELLGGASLFRVRFRAYGAIATYIDYWYVDDVKVWVPEYVSATLTVASADGPVEGCPVTLTADHGAVAGGVTGQGGRLSLPMLEQGTYRVSIANAGYNVYEGTWTVGPGQANDFTAALTRPLLGLSPGAVDVSLAADATQQQTVTMRNTGDGPMAWHLNVAPERLSGDASTLWSGASSFRASGDLQSAVAFDGEHYFTSSSIELGMFWQYDRQGRFEGQFRIPGFYYPVYDLTYDGRYFYGSDGTNSIYVFDLDNRRLADTITVAEQPSLEITHCTYDPDNDGFWIGGGSTLARIDRQGRLTARLQAFDASASLSVIGTAYDNLSPGGPYLWLADGASRSDIVDRVTLRQYNISTRSLTGVEHLVTDVPGYVIGNAATGVNNIGGIFSSLDVSEGKLTLIGVLQQSPSLVFSYTLCDVGDWLSIAPRHGTLQPGEEQQLAIGISALGLAKGDSRSIEAGITMLPAASDTSLAVTLNVNADAPAPRPQQLAATPGDGEVSLSWQAGQPQPMGAPLGYNVYRGGRKVNRELVEAGTYTDQGLVYGEYTYRVTAVYGGNVESAMSDSVVAFVKRGAQHYAPLSVAATLANNKDVSLTWQSPLAGAQQPATASWASGTHADEMGMGEGGYFWAASAWSAQDLVPYRNKPIEAVSVQIVNPCSYLALIIYKDGQPIYRKAHGGAVSYDGTPTVVTVDEPLTVEPGCEYYFAFQIMNAANVNPLSLDAGPAVEGKGNLLSMDGENWFPASYQAISGNFNISVSLGAADAQAEQAPLGYNVYRDGQKLNAEPVGATAYTDAIDEPGRHSYAVSSVYAGGWESPLSQAATVTVEDLGERAAPTTIDATVELNRNVTLRWNYPGEQGGPGSGVATDTKARPVTAALPEYVSSFSGASTGVEMAIASDNRYIYTSALATEGGVNKYSLTGEFIESFTIEGLQGIRNMAWDGESFYVTDNQTSIHRVDMDARRLVETLPVSEYGRHIAYIPTLDGGNGGFEVGDWETSIYVTKRGAKTGTGPTLRGASGTGYHDGRIYAFEQGGETQLTIGVYDAATLERLGSLDAGAYAELGDVSQCTAGGMSVIERPDGMACLAMAMQNPAGRTRFLFIELEPTTGVVGYNVYRNGQRLNAEPLERRHWAEPLDAEGTYRYAVETVYIDGTTSPRSGEREVTIAPKGEAPAPAHVKATASTYGYNVLVSFADPAMYDGALDSSDFEDAPAGQPLEHGEWVNAGSEWRVTTARAYDGSKAMEALADRRAMLVIPAEGMGWIAFAACNADDHQGSGSLELLYSTGSTAEANFIPLQTCQTTEAWQAVGCALPEGTRYVALRKQAATYTQYVDAVRLYAGQPESSVYGFDVYRDGSKLNTEPLAGISYVDHNLAQGTYSYQVSLTTKTSAVSELSEPVSVEVSYDNGGQAPDALTATQQPDGSVRLAWRQPAIGEPVYLRWDDGNSYDAGGLPSGGAFYAGARWYASDLADYGHLTLTNVEFYVNQVPDALFVLVYQGGTVVRQQYVPQLKQYSFNNVRLDEPLAVDPSKDMIVALYVEHNEITVPLGYDRGPAREGRGNLYSTDGATWGVLSDDDTGIDANWNIAIGLSPYTNAGRADRLQAPRRAPAQLLPGRASGQRLMAVPAAVERASGVNTFLGYNVYRNSELLNSSYVADTTYTDLTPPLLPYLEYQVAAVYSLTGESLSDKVTLTINSIGGPTAGGLEARLDDGRLLVSGAEPGCTITLSTAGGALVGSAVASAAGSATLTLGPAAAGTYVLRAGGESLKIAVGLK